MDKEEEDNFKPAWLLIQRVTYQTLGLYFSEEEAKKDLSNTTRLVYIPTYQVGEIQKRATDFVVEIEGEKFSMPKQVWDLLLATSKERDYYKAMQQK